MGKTGRAAVDSLIRQYEFTFGVLRRTIECFSPEQWVSGISSFEVPVKVAYHTLQCLLYYFREDPGKTYREIPMRFGKDWWGLEPDELPSQKEMLEFLGEIIGLIGGRLSGLDDTDLSREFPGMGTVLGHVTYAMRHTMHHQGGLNVLAVHHGIDVDLWDREE